MRNSRSSALAVLAAIAMAALAATVSAHRLDEYLQAARVALDPERVAIELDLTPGAAIARSVINDIDTDGNGSIGVEEGRAYGARVMNDITVQVDDRPLTIALGGIRVPAIDALLKGEGTIRLQLTASVQHRGAEPHRLVYGNRHRRDVGVYLANTLVPASDRIVVLTQHRDVDQRELTVEYTLSADPATSRRGWLPVSIGIVLALLAALLWRRMDAR